MTGEVDSGPRSAALAPGASGRGDDLLGALLDGLADGLVVCDRFLSPIAAGAAARWLLARAESAAGPEEGASVPGRGGWAATAAAAQVQDALGRALDAQRTVTVALAAGDERWEARAAPLRHPAAAACVTLRPVLGPDLRQDAVLRAAHDLKSPLHAIQGFAKLLLREAVGPLSSDQRRFLEHAASEAQRLRESIERLLDVVREAESESAAAPGTISHGEAAAADVAAALEDAAARFAGAFAAQGVLLSTGGAPIARAALPDAEVQTIIDNLVVNALAATPPGGGVALTVEPASGGRIVCRVRDTGPGIPEVSLERIFQPHFRVPERGAPGGTGLGLAISQGIAEARGGRLWAANGPNGGAIFTLELPAAGEIAATPRLRLAPVSCHVALAGARAELDTHLPGRWRVFSWEEGALTVEVDGTRAAATQAATAIARETHFACWLVDRAGTPANAAPRALAGDD